MLLNNNVFKKDKIVTIIANELREKYGIKYRKEKKIKNAAQIQQQTVKNIETNLFGMPIDLLELKELQLKNGTNIQIPTFVYVTCERILQYKFTEGLFRKAGSTSRQKDIRTQLESGIPLLENDEQQNHHIIDIANILKLFFRELPMALIPPGILQDTMLRCLLCKTQGDQINALMLSLLLLPSINLNTLAYFMDFLKEISLNSSENKMTIDNLAIIFTPNLMPILPENVTQRLNSHVRIIKLLIEYSHCIGEIPEHISIKIPNSSVGNLNNVIGDGSCDTDANDNPIIIENNKVNLHIITDTEKKKKKRRSGSLTRMFNGLRKMVGAFDSSAEGLDEKSPEHIPATPCIHNKSTTKRRLLEAGGSAFSTKKKKDVLALLPNNNQQLLPNTPMSQKNTKKSRLILMGKTTHVKKSNKTGPENASSNVRGGAGNHTIDKRWSAISSNWTRRKLTIDDSMQDKSDQESSLVSSSLLSSSSLITTTAAMYNSMGEHPNNNIGNVVECMEINNKSVDDDSKKQKHQSNEENYVRISKMEYEAIKERVSAIESRISQEFCNVEAKLSTQNKMHAMDTDLYQTLNGPEKVLNKYEQTLEEIDAINTTPSTERLAKRLSRNLKIRRSAEQIIIRSPSARKIGTIRRRSRENLPLIRHQSCNYGNSTARSSNSNGNYTTEVNHNNNNNTENVSCSGFYPLKTNLKRGRPNTVQSGLRSSGRSPTKKSTNADAENEIWTSADQYFNQNRITDHLSSSPLRQRSQNIIENNQLMTMMQQTPVFISSINMGKIKTPILPPRQISLMKQSPTPMIMKIDSDYNKSTEKPMKSQNSSAQKSNQTPGQFNIPPGGRASIAKLRAQNAGMVMAKAKIFSQMENITNNINPTNNNNSINTIEDNYRLPLTKNERISSTSSTTSIPAQQHQLKSSSTLKQTKINRPITNNLIAINNSPKLMTTRRIGSVTNVIGTKKISCQKVHHKNTVIKPIEQIETNEMLCRQNNTNNNQNRSSEIPTLDTNMNSNLKILRSDIHNIIKSHLDSPPPPPPSSSQTPNNKKNRRNLNNNINMINSPITINTTPRIKRPLIIKSPKNLVKTPRSKLNKKPSPMRANTPLKLRNSPRLHVQRTNF